MAATHDYETTLVPGADLTADLTLVGECGGLSAIFDVSASQVPWVRVKTEHGPLYLDPEHLYEVLSP